MNRRKGTIQGIARNVQWREQSNRYSDKERDTILTFRIERTDSEGNIIDYVPVELKGTEIRGALVDGDEVAVVGKISRLGIVQPQQIFNVKTKAYITSRDNESLGCTVIFLIFVFALIFGFINVITNPGPEPTDTNSRESPTPKPTRTQASPTPKPTRTQASPTSKPTRTQASTPLSGCVLTIDNSLVSLMSKPNQFSLKLIRVRPGKYTPLGYKTINTAIGEEGWFQIESGGRKGWIENDTWTIHEKSSTCP